MEKIRGLIISFVVRYPLYAESIVDHRYTHY